MSGDVVGVDNGIVKVRVLKDSKMLMFLTDPKVQNALRLSLSKFGS